MPWFWKPYTSDVTSFIDELKAKRPTLEDEQRRGRSLLWDRHIDLVAEEDHDESKVPQQPYVYQTHQP
jgi:hypothetical protein